MCDDHDRRRYNLPIVDEVAMIVPGEDPGEDLGRDCAHWKVHVCCDSCESIKVILPIPHSAMSFFSDMATMAGTKSSSCTNPASNNPSDLTQIRYAAYRIQVRRREFLAIVRCGRLFQQYIVGSCRTFPDQMGSAQSRYVVSSRVQWSGLEDAIGAADGNVDLRQLEQGMILSSLFIGSPRHMQQRFQDTMATAHFYGKVDVFLTMTANPKWDEITWELRPGQHDQPDIVTRVFQLKEALLKESTNDDIFGHTLAHVYTIEF